MAIEDGGFVDVEEFLAEEKSMSAAVDGLTYMMHADEDMALVGLYAKELEAQVRGLEALLRSADPNARRVCARLWN